MCEYLELLFDYERSGFNHIGVFILERLDYRSLIQVRSPSSATSS
jgi:hypothetical protein